MLLDVEKAKKFFCIAFKVKGRGSEFGSQKETVFKFISQEFNIVDEKALERYFNEMILAKFLLAGENGIKANSNLELEFEEFKNKKEVSLNANL